MEKLIKRDEIWVQKAKEIYKIKQLRLHYEKLEKQLLCEFKVLNNGVNSIGRGYRFIISTRIGIIDYKSIPELKNVDLSQYRSKNIETCSLEYVGNACVEDANE